MKTDILVNYSISINYGMSSKDKLREFLDNHKADGIWTHTSLAGGSYFIPEDDLPRFYELYIETITDQEKLYLTEKSSDIGPLRIDFDFVYSREVEKHLHTRDQVTSFIGAYMTEIKQYLELPPSVQLYVMEKRKPTLDSKKNVKKSGIHIVVPSVCTHKFVEQRVRRNLLKTMDQHFGGLPLNDSWDKVYDEQVVNRSCPWTLYGSRKNDPNALPYLVSYIVDWSPNGVKIIDDIPQASVALMRTLSLQRNDCLETPQTDEAKAIYAGLKQQYSDVRISGGRAVAPARGRPAIRGCEPGSRGSSPTGRVIIPPLDPDDRNYYRDHTMNMNPSRAVDYGQWQKVGQCLFNIHPDLLDVFLDFSAQAEDKYDEAGCHTMWGSLKFRNDGDRVQAGTLRYWSREDNQEGYIEIESRNVDRLILVACSGTEHDVAALIHAKFRDHYICCDFGKNVWYRWAGHIWRETDRGINLQLKLSKEIAGLFFKKSLAISMEMETRNLLTCTGDNKKECGTCEHCQLDAQRNKFNFMYTKLKTTKFKDNVMKECRELFFDEEFTKLVDSNKDLIAFNNGVMDLTKMEFRDGKPQDYLSFSTGLDYDASRKYYEYETWNAVDSFIKQVLPDPVVRDYFMKHLATNLVGGNTAQKFHILTGSGSNGKSMIMNLTSTALGDYACTVPISLFTQKRKGSGNAAPEVIRLKGRRFVTMQEPDESIALNTGLMKEITSGEKMYARDLFKSGTEFEVQAKFHLACNDKPKINTTDGGTWRRLVVINFLSKFVPKPSGPNEFPMDESIQFAVQGKEWATPFMSYLVHILTEGKGLRKLPPPEKVLEYTSEYRNENDGIARFVSEKLVPIVEGDQVVAIDRTTLKRVFKQWMTDNDLRLSPTDMEKRVEVTYGKYHKGGWTNFKIEA
jgi:P4 family phage/plasmid primase-like protien